MPMSGYTLRRYQQQKAMFLGTKSDGISEKEPDSNSSVAAVVAATCCRYTSALSRRASFLSEVAGRDLGRS